MNTTTQTLQHHPAHESALKWVAGGSMMEAIGAIATIALAIVGLAGVLPMTMASIATIVVGAAILLEGGALGGSQYLAHSGFESAETSVASEGMGASFLGGVAGIVLGILALLGIASQTLLSVAVLALGTTLLLTGAAASQSNWLASASGGHVFVGLAAVVLGILAVIGLSPLTLVLVGLLCLGAGALFSGSAHGVRMVSETQHT